MDLVQALFASVIYHRVLTVHDVPRRHVVLDLLHILLSRHIVYFRQLQRRLARVSYQSYLVGHVLTSQVRLVPLLDGVAPASRHSDAHHVPVSAVGELLFGGLAVHEVGMLPAEAAELPLIRTVDILELLTILVDDLGATLSG